MNSSPVEHWVQEWNIDALQPEVHSVVLENQIRASLFFIKKFSSLVKLSFLF